MSVLWILPLVVVSIGAVVAVVALRRTAGAVDELAAQARGLSEMSHETAALRDEVHAAIVRGQGLRHRPPEPSG